MLKSSGESEILRKLVEWTKTKWGDKKWGTKQKWKQWIIAAEVKDLKNFFLLYFFSQVKTEEYNFQKKLKSKI